MSRRLAVLMTAYNAEKTIGKAIESLKRDTEPFDLLIVDDCSRRPGRRRDRRCGRRHRDHPAGTKSRRRRCQEFRAEAPAREAVSISSP